MIAHPAMYVHSILGSGDFCGAVRPQIGEQDSVAVARPGGGRRLPAHQRADVQWRFRQHVWLVSPISQPVSIEKIIPASRFYRGAIRLLWTADFDRA
jgi:hypothetical protein